MGAADALTRKYMQDNERFADAFNFYLYGGRQVIKPEFLRQTDTASVILPYGENAKPVKIQRFRDILKMMVIKRDSDAAYAILGIENQTAVHYAMLIRNMLYDAIQYAIQVEDAAKSHRNGKAKPGTGDEFLSGFYRTDKLIPVITLTIYFGPDKWDAPTSLHEMLAVKDPEILRFVDDHHLNLITPESINDEDFSKFRSELGIALQYLKYSKNKEMTSRLLHDKLFTSVISRETAELIGINTDKLGKGVDHMYNEALESIFDDYRKEGERKGRAEGIAEGRADGALSMLIDLVGDGLLSLSDAAARAGMTVSEFESRMSSNI